MIPPLTARVITDRLILRAPRPGDVGELRRALRANALHLRPWSPAPVPGEDPTSITAISKQVLRNRREWKRGISFVLLVFDRASQDRIVGRVALGGVMRGVFQNAYVGYWIDAERQGQGLMTEAVRATTEFAFRECGLHRLQAAVMPKNAASQRVLGKVGYRREGLAERYLCIAGTWEDHVLFAITADEWPRAALAT